ncbi:MAG: prepilin-type N-terminal cleavage/methylation domain-containing protein [Verrucomicrobiota bacterium]
MGHSANPNALPFTQRGNSFSLSPRERAGVRGKEPSLCPRFQNRLPKEESSACAAFTMIEVMIVLGIIAMLMAWGLPAFVTAVQKKPLPQAVSDIMDGCKEARALAIMSGVPAELVINAEGEISVQKSQATSAQVDPALGGDESDASKALFHARLDESIALEALDVNLRDMLGPDISEARVKFYPNGTSDEFNIVFRVDDQWRQVKLDIVTGLAEVETDPMKFMKR